MSSAASGITEKFSAVFTSKAESAKLSVFYLRESAEILETLRSA
jgi:hypothetical protein